MGIVVKSKVKDLVELNVGEDLVGELDAKVEEILRKAEERARTNGRKTIYGRDV